MKHLRRFNESISDVNDLQEVEELFYPLSDELQLNVKVIKDRYRIINFTKPIMYHGRADINRIYNIGRIPDNLVDDPTYPVIRVLITKSPIVSHSLINEPKYKMDINTFADELKFPIDYLLNEKGLRLSQVWASRQANYGNNYPDYLYYKDLDTLVGDQNMGKSMLSLVLYFGD